MKIFSSMARWVALVTVMVAGLATARAQVVVANPVGDSLAGTGLSIDAENFRGIRFTIDRELTVSGLEATFLSSDGSSLAAVFMSVRESGFPLVAPINPGHPDVVNGADVEIFTPGIFENAPTYVMVPYSTVLDAGTYVLMLVPINFGDAHALQEFDAVTGSAGVNYSQEVDESGFIVNGTGAWALGLGQPDIRILGTLAAIPEPSTVALWLGGVAAGVVAFRRRRSLSV